MLSTKAMPMKDRSLFNFMPNCPKCGKLISAKKFKRHLERCGESHKHVRASLTSGDNFLERV